MNVVFLDRDGTINDDKTGYISNPEDLHLFPFTAEAIKIFNELALKTVVVTNQSGIARGLLTIEQLEDVHNYMLKLLLEQGAIIDKILYSPYYKNGIIEPFNKEHISRKPNPGMFFDAMKFYPIKAKSSFMIGDKPADISFGKQNGLITILVKTGLGLQTWENTENLQFKPDFVVDNVLSAANLIKFIKKIKKM